MIYERCCAHASAFKKVLFQSMNIMWNKIADYAYEHRFCRHQCLSVIKPESQQCSEDDAECPFNGIGIFCHAYKELACDLVENQTQYFKQIVPVHHHKHCICDDAQDTENCPVHCWNTSDDDEDDKSETERGGNTLSDAKDENGCHESLDICWGGEFTKEDLEHIEGVETEYNNK